MNPYEPRQKRPDVRVSEEDVARKTLSGAYTSYTPRRPTEKPSLEGEKVEVWNGKT